MRSTNEVMALAWLSLALCLGGMLPFVWFVAHAEWGQGGELQGGLS